MSELASPGRTKKIFLITLIYLTCLFVLFQLIVIGQQFFYIFSESAIREFVNARILHSPMMIVNIIFFLAAHLFLYLMLIGFVYYGSLAIDSYGKKKHLIKIGLALWLWSILLILMANQLYFPQSRFSFLVKLFPSISLVMMKGIFLCLLTGILLVISGLLIQLARKKYSLYGILTIVILSLSIFIYGYIKPTLFLNDPKQPNIIIIGIDSLRVDYLSPSVTPHLSQFLEKSTRFTNAITVLGRTYPAWVSLLTGNFPTTTGIRDDLSPVELKYPTLGQKLREQGYTTLYAIDESRFSAVDERFGFTHTVYPPMGFGNFFFGEINDFPLSNLLMNTLIGKWLFPYNYMNRASYVTYQPALFNQEIFQTIDRIKKPPVFIAVHFNLIHFPYLWAGSKVIPNKPLSETYRYYYHEAVSAVDAQVGDFLNGLAQRKILDNAMIVIVADHGESLNMPGERLTQPSQYRGKRPSEKTLKFFASNMGVGHGTDLLTMSQNRILMAFYLSGHKKNQPGTRTETVSLFDIPATVMAYLNINPFKTDGINLMPTLCDVNAKRPTRTFYLETGFTPDSLKDALPSAAKILKETLQFQFLDVNSKRLVINPMLINAILLNRQLAILNDHWLLVMLPKPNPFTILVDLSTGYWSIDMESSFAKSANVRQRLEQMRQHFKQ